MSARLVLATHNRHKLGELRAVLLPALDSLLPDDVASSSDVGAPDVPETGVTFAENALLKARALAAFTGLPAVADDSGLCVDVLGGAPGVFSARWSGRHGDDAANTALLLAQLADVPEPHRGAEFRCAAALVTPDGAERVTTGLMRGRLTTAPRGSGGFGYDPILVPDDQPDPTRELTSAELTAEQKNAISHRVTAFRELAPWIVAVLTGQGIRPT
ncbi:MAG TPA: RdgB/HAM1 family non-canonical purine NTP pyrophosphatase [Euzebyales bacterium]|nr:RdgB/HAM1 family non-canonical purine NTP pyrophosphatase [Euzebyales bacterium]